MSMLRPALVSFAALTVLTGLVYPLVITEVGQMVFPGKVNGSLIVKNGRVLGSELIGQHTEEPKYFWGRLSATGDFATNAANSGGSNLAPSNPELQKVTARRIQALQAADPANSALVPVDLVTASGSGLDPHITPAAAEYQIRRVARARGLTESSLRDLVGKHIEGRTFGILGEPRVNVLKLNLTLDGISS
jgi:K+-transporting ATPase ATPase C chain